MEKPKDLSRSYRTGLVHHVSFLNDAGVSVYPLDELVELARRFESHLWIRCDNGKRVSMQSLTALEDLEGQPYRSITIEAHGSDAKTTVAIIANVFLTRAQKPMGGA